jgi:cysteinyl-tRNA synthetase
MSKSRNNFFAISDITKNYHSDILRFFLATVHYRSVINFSNLGVLYAKYSVQRFYRCVVFLSSSNIVPNDYYLFFSKFLNAVNDDFKTSIAISVLFRIMKKVNIFESFMDTNEAGKYANLLFKLSKIIGLFQKKSTFSLNLFHRNLIVQYSQEDIRYLISKRLEARKDKNWPLSDRIRNILLYYYISIQDNSNNTLWRYS